MPSALRPTRSTRAWRQLRAAHAATLPRPCWRCHHTIQPTDPWVLGHIIDRADGDDDQLLAPEHEHCGKSAGATAQVARARARKAQQAAATAFTYEGGGRFFPRASRQCQTPRRSWSIEQSTTRNQRRATPP